MPSETTPIINDEQRCDALAQVIADQVKDLVKSNFTPVKRIMLDEGKSTMKLAFGVDFEEQIGGFEVKTSVAYSRKYKDEREEFCDPNQAHLDFEEE